MLAGALVSCAGRDPIGNAEDECPGAHQFLVPGTTTCACVAGFTLAGGECAWTGLVADPGLDAPAGSSGWTFPPHVVSYPLASGSWFDTGVVRFGPLAMLELDAIE